MNDKWKESTTSLSAGHLTALVQRSADLRFIGGASIVWQVVIDDIAPPAGTAETMKEGQTMAEAAIMDMLIRSVAALGGRIVWDVEEGKEPRHGNG